MKVWVVTSYADPGNLGHLEASIECVFATEELAAEYAKQGGIRYVQEFEVKGMPDYEEPSVVTCA
jgi:hypothetical protein